MKLSRHWVVMSAIGAVLALAVSTSNSPTAEPVRHTITTGQYLVPADGRGHIWMRIDLTRETWITPRGAGRIHETRGTDGFPTVAEMVEWETAGRPSGPPTIDSEFGAGELVYWRLDGVPKDLAGLEAVLRESGASGREVLRRLSSLLTETVPPPELVDRTVEAISSMNDISVLRSGESVTAKAELDTTGRILIELTFDMRSHRLAGEARLSLDPISYLDLVPPIEMFERSILLSEDLASWPP